MKILRGGGAPKIFRHPKGELLKTVGLGGGLRKFVYSKANRRGRWLLKKLTASEGVPLKFQASSFNIFIPPVILNELSLNLICGKTADVISK